MKRAADGGVPGVEDQAELAELEVAGRAEVREAGPRHVLDDDAHAELALQLLELGEGALQRVDDAWVAGKGAAAVVGVHHVGERPDLGGRLEMSPVDLHGVSPVALPQAARLEVVVRAVNGEPQAAGDGRAAVHRGEQVVLVGRADLRQFGARGDAFERGGQRQPVPGVGGQADVGRELHGPSVPLRRASLGAARPLATPAPAGLLDAAGRLLR